MIATGVSTALTLAAAGAFVWMPEPPQAPEQMELLPQRPALPPQSFKGMTILPAWATCVYAGVPRLDLTLTAKDEAGQMAESAPFELALPDRPYQSPVARRLDILRRAFVLGQLPPEIVALQLDAIAADRQAAFPDDAARLTVQAVTAKIRAGATGNLEPAKMLCEIIDAVELNAATEADKKLQQAQHELDKTLAQEQAAEDELNKRRDDLQKAAEDFLKEKAEAQNKEKPGSAPTDKEIEQAMAKNKKALDEIAREDPKAAAQALKKSVEHLQQKMQKPGSSPSKSQPQQKPSSESAAPDKNQPKENQSDSKDKQNDPPEKQDEKDKPADLKKSLEEMKQEIEKQKKESERRQEMTQAQQKLQALSKKQQDLMDETFREDRRENPVDLKGDPIPKKQLGLQTELREIVEHLKEKDVKAKDLAQADTLMGQAADEIDQADDGNAVRTQGRVIQSLQDALKDLDQQKKKSREQQQGEDQGQNDPSQGNAPEQKDGKAPDGQDGDGKDGKNGQGESKTSKAGNGKQPNQETDDGRPINVFKKRDSGGVNAARIEDELRRRLSNPDLPADERDYYNRLLNKSFSGPSP